MHVPDGVLSAPVCLVTNGLAATAVTYSAWQVSRGPVAPSPIKCILVSAAVFAVQLLNFPLVGGASGHLIGAVFAGAVLGPSSGILAVSIVLAVQAMVFGDGGVTTLGANILNMALVGAIAGGWLPSESRENTRLASRARAASIAIAAVPLAATMCALELAVGAARPLDDTLAALVPFHAALGIVEACLTWAALELIARAATKADTQNWKTGRKAAVTLAIAVMTLAAVFAPMASTLPDGMETALGQLQIADSPPPGWIPAQDYVLPGLANESVALVAAASLGTIAVAGCAWVLTNAARLRAAAANPRRRDSSQIL